MRHDTDTDNDRDSASDSVARGEGKNDENIDHYVGRGINDIDIVSDNESVNGVSDGEAKSQIEDTVADVSSRIKSEPNLQSKPKIVNTNSHQNMEMKHLHQVAVDIDPVSADMNRNWKD